MSFTERLYNDNIWQSDQSNYMQVKNSLTSYGVVAIVLHWLTAVGVIGLFSLGLWMDGLDYYHEYYRTAPHIHKSVGVLLISLVILRFIWRQLNTKPEPLRSHDKWEIILAKIVHYVFYVLLLCMFISGYLITTAEGDSLAVFNWFSLPSLISSIPNLEDDAGKVHEIVAYSLIGLAILHVLGAFKHHFIDKDLTLIRMITPGENK